jgi:hypothetical protein
MADANIISIAITLFAIAAGSLFNNVRIPDLATATHARFDDMRDLARAENVRTQDKLDTVLKMLANLDTRVTRLEERNR